MQWMRGWCHDTADISDLTPEHVRGTAATQTELPWVDPLKKMTVCDRGLCLLRMEFLLDVRKHGPGCATCILTSPCAHLHLLRFAAPDTEFHVYMCQGEPPDYVLGVTYHDEPFTHDMAPRTTWALFGSADTTLDYHKQLLTKCVPTAGYLIVVQDLEPSLPQGNMVYPLWAPFDSRAFILHHPVFKGEHIKLQVQKRYQSINMPVLLLEMNHFHREIRRYTFTNDESREQNILSECVETMGFHGTNAAAPLTELIRNILPPKPDHEVAQLLHLLQPTEDPHTQERTE